MSWKRELPKCQPQVLSRLATDECKQLQPGEALASHNKHRMAGTIQS